MHVSMQIMAWVLFSNTLAQPMKFFTFWCPSALHSVFVLLLQHHPMERLKTLGMNPNVPRSQLLLYLYLNQRTHFYHWGSPYLRREGLTQVGDELVGRRCTAKGKPLNEKLLEDVWSLLCCLKYSSSITRAILKNGKRDQKYVSGGF